MPDFSIFAVGVFVFLLLMGGFVFTVLEIRRLDKDQNRK